MKNNQEFRVSCESRGPHDATVLYSGIICQAGAMALEHQFQSLFDYYQYNRIELQLESPGGSAEAMYYILRQMQQFEEQGRVIAIRSSFVCASAAAVMLALGSWGERRVDRSTALLFHTSRVESGPGGMTAALSTSLSQSLQSVDRRLVDLLVDQMLKKTGGEGALAQLVLDRCQYVEVHWAALASQLGTLYSEPQIGRKPPWLRSLAKLARQGTASGKFANELKRHLHGCMQRDERMDVRHAYTLLLVDQVDGVIQADALSPKSSNLPVRGDASTPPTSAAYMAIGQEGCR